MKKDLMINGVGIMSIIDDKYYITNEEFECYRECTRIEFIEELKKYSWVCLTTWDEKLKQDYLELVDYCKNMNK